jgi:hypothetical protein
MKAVGLALMVVGGFTTIPLAISIIGKENLTRPEIRSAANLALTSRIHGRQFVSDAPEPGE